jgi:hypothetical protein
MQLLASALTSLVLLAASAAQDPISKLGPVSVEDVSIDPDGSVRYTFVNESRDLMFHQVEITREFADGTHHRAVQEHDSFERSALIEFEIGSFVLHAVWTATGRSAHLHPGKTVARPDLPIAAQVRVSVAALADGTAFGNRARLRKLLARREAMVLELGYWLHLFEGVHQSAQLLDGEKLAFLYKRLSRQRQRELSPDFRLALLKGIQMSLWASSTMKLIRKP